MENREIARSFRQLAELMELHGENPFRVRTYANAHVALRKMDIPLSEMKEDELSSIKGVGASVAKKIRELVDAGSMEALEKYRAKTPEGIQQILSIKGIGPKKVRQIWKELDIRSPGELLYACQENRLVSLKGFGLKTQQDYIAKIEYFLDSREKSLYASVEDDALALIDLLGLRFPEKKIAIVGELARKCQVIHSPSLLIEAPVSAEDLQAIDQLEILDGTAPDGRFQVKYADKMKWTFYSRPAGSFEKERFALTADQVFFREWTDRFTLPDPVNHYDGIFEDAGIQPVPAEIMEGEGTVERIVEEGIPALIADDDIRGILHNHSTYSDGLHTLREMSEYVRACGYAYFGICDHSRSAFYANGMPPERVIEQVSEIEEINREMTPFKVFKGIESDILNDGSLDYADDILELFDFVVASVHANLRMDEQKATSRLVRAIENPYTRILGHPTGRLLLSRKGYPIDHMKVIDACAANGVVIELNANPLRLDLDHRWIPYALEKGVMIAINPDAHSMGGIHLTRYGVLSARKGWLTKEMCLNAKSLDEFQAWIDHGRSA